MTKLDPQELLDRQEELNEVVEEKLADCKRVNSAVLAGIERKIQIEARARVFLVIGLITFATGLAALGAGIALFMMSEAT